MNIIREKSIIVSVNSIDPNTKSADYTKSSTLILGTEHFATLGTLPGEMVMVQGMYSGRSAFVPVELDTTHPKTVKLQGCITALIGNSIGNRFEISKLSLI